MPLSFFGMTIHQTDNYPTVPIGALGKGSCVDWVYVEPSRGVYNWSTLDAFVNLAQKKGVDIFYSNAGEPVWAASNPAVRGPSGCDPNILTGLSAPNEQDLIDFYTALVTRYKGRIKYYELWNEPDQYPNITIPQMVRITTDEYDIIRAIDPNAQIITPSMDGNDPSYYASYFADGGPTGVDIASLHAYPDTTSASADVPEAITSNRYLLGPLLPILMQYLPNKPLWDTEGSWNETGQGNFTTPAQQAAFIARFYILHWSNGISRTYWYAWDDAEYGTLEPSLLGSSVPAVAFRELQKWMVGATFRSPCTLARDRVIWTCSLSRPRGYRALIIWDTKGKQLYTPPKGYSKYLDLSGDSYQISGKITLGVKPLMLEK